MVGLTACTHGTASPPAEEPPLDAVVMSMDAASLDPNMIESTLDPYVGEGARLDVLGQAIDVVQQECLGRFGLDVPLPEPEGGTQWPLPTWDWHGLWDEQTAQVYGYGSPPLRSRPALSSSVPLEWHPVLIGEVEVFNGEEVPEGGCQGEAFRAIGDDDDLGLIDAGGLQRRAVTEARQHSAVEALIDEWSACLASAGWVFRDPADPFQVWPDVGPDPPAAELEMALADITCKKESGLLRVWVAAEVAYQRILMEENAERLRELEEWRDEARRRANDIIAGGA